MADLTYSAALDDKISPALQKIQQHTQKTVESFNGLKTAIAALGFASLTKSAVAYADSLADISDATGIAVENIMGFSKAVQAAGGNTEKALAGISKFGLTLGDAAQGSLDAQFALAQVGITLEDLRKLSEAELLSKAIKGLDNISNSSLRATIQNDIFGKSVRGVNMQKVAEGYDKASAASLKYAKSIKEAADLQDNLDRAIGTVKLSVLKAIEPLARFVNNLDPDKVDSFINAVVKIGGAAGALVGLSKAFDGLVKILAILGGYFALFGRGAAMVVVGSTGAAAALASLGKTAAITLSVLTRYAIPAWLASGSFKALLGEIALTFATLGKRIGFATAAFGGLAGAVGVVIGGLVRILASVAAVASAIILVNEAIDLAFDINPIKSMGDWLEALVTEYFPPLAAMINSLGAALGMAPGKLAATSKELEATKQKQLDQENKIKDALQKQRDEISFIGKAFKDQLDKRAEQLQLETELVGKTEAQKTLQQALFDLRQKSNDEVEKLQKAIAILGDKEKGLTADYEAQITKIKDLTAAEEQRLKTIFEGLNAAKAAEELRQFGIKQETDALEKLRDLEHEIATVTMTGIEKKYADITYAARKAAEEAIRTEEIRRGALLTEEEKQKYYELANKRTEELINKEGKLYEKSREFSTGWKKAFGDYVDNATNAAKKAEQIFSKAMSGMEDLIVNFAKTGKFEWKNFVNMMAEELLRAQIQQIFAQMFGGMQNTMRGGMTPRGNTGGIFGGNTGGIFGGNTGGIFGGGNQGGGNILSGIGNVIGGIAGGIGSVVKGIGSTIGDLFGGWFANGGTLGAGQWGIAGERGPELISGPASITPMGSTNVTYNISAVDAQSFQALVARDPQFIHAVAMQGARSIPQGRR